MSEYRQTLERLRKLYQHSETEQTTLPSEHGPDALTPGLCTAKMTPAEEQHYYHGFLDGIIFFYACTLNYPVHRPSSGEKEADKP